VSQLCSYTPWRPGWCELAGFLIPGISLALITVMAQQTTPTDVPSSTRSADLRFRSPDLTDGGGMWRVARASRTLDLNSSYTYLLFARDFAATSRVAISAGEVVGFVIGYLRPEAEDRLFIWQIAVDQSQRGQGVAARLLEAL